ncbi:MAG TPA: winged helix-turn-helix domain-containing protein [Niastella sp.]
MRVNSAFTGFFANRLVVGSGIAIVMLAIFFITSSFKKHSDRDLRAKQVNLSIRQIGHRLLLQAGDSTSRILPVTEVKEGTFLLKFEKEFVFNHDSLIVLSRGLLPKKQFPSGYTITVHDCMKGDIVYGFQVNNTSPDILACRHRSQPPGCYTIEFTFPNFYENVKQQKADIDQRTSALISATTSDYDIDQRTSALKSFKVDPREANPKPSPFKTTTAGYQLMNLVFGGILVLLVVTLLIGRFGKILKPVPVQHQDHAIIKESVPEMAALGKFLFNVKGQLLLLGSEEISLTDKECKILELLHKNFGELIPRETLMQEVWINEGVITGRSLDMFISKLRKKLSADPDLRITNIHGKGYRLETVNDFIA